MQTRRIPRPFPARRNEQETVPSEGAGEPIPLTIITGFLGGFTTFSAFGIETVTLMRNGLPVLACVYVASSVALGAACVFLGLRLAI